MRSLIAICLVLGGCQFIPGTDASKMHAARSAVEYRLADASSARYRNERVVTSDGRELVCGEVNSKNPLGAYPGFTAYWYDPANKDVGFMPQQIASNEQAVAALHFPDSCDPPTRL